MVFSLSLDGRLLRWLKSLKSIPLKRKTQIQWQRARHSVYFTKRCIAFGWWSKGENSSKSIRCEIRFLLKLLWLRVRLGSIYIIDFVNKQTSSERRAYSIRISIGICAALLKYHHEERKYLLRIPLNISIWNQMKGSPLFWCGSFRVKSGLWDRYQSRENCGNSKSESNFFQSDLNAFNYWAALILEAWKVFRNKKCLKVLSWNNWWNY